ncbi:MAG: hypothetical protein J7507_03310 [Pseudoxanthomonas sp.]|nr:hypothetical protein [Pseudoxanthomonas sp.]
MPRCCWLALLIFAIPSFDADAIDRLEIRVNRLQGVLDLAISYCGGQGESVALQKLLESAGYRSGDPPGVMLRFCTVDIGQNAVGYPGRPLAYNTGWSSPWQRVLNASVASSDMAEFQDRIAGAFTFPEQQAIVDGLRYMEPIYERLVETAIGSRGKEMAASVSAHMDRKNVPGLMRSISNLYATPWPDDMPLWIGLSPIPPGSGGFSATANGNVVRSFMPVDFDRPDVYASVIAHEFCHVLYSNMPLDRIEAIQHAFSASASPNRRLAEIWMNEALATAAGNGWVYRELTGSEDKEAWYDDPVIDPYAKAIAPVVYRALDSGKALDASMAAQFIVEFDRIHPDALRNPAVLLPHATIVSNTDATSLASMRSTFGQQIGIRRLDALAPDVAGNAELAPAVIHVDISETDGVEMKWRRNLRADGRIDFSIRLRSPAAFGGALAALITRIRDNEWPE